MKKKILVAIGGLLLVAGCSPAMVHPAAAPKSPAMPPPVTAQPVSEQTVADSAYTISDDCRAELAALPKGPAILARYDLWFGYWKTQGDPANEVANTATGFRYEAKAAGATSC